MSCAKTEVIVSLGSNLAPTEAARDNLRRALVQLTELLTDVTHSSIYITPAEGNAHGTYANCVLRGFTTMTREDLVQTLKQMERDFGRTAADKLTGRVPLDLDLERWDTTVLRPADWQRNYMQQGLAQLIL
jgi:2-amino-4-hydroxy-6-hydroxymethyldihydropteridine diphosphokinase